MAALSLPSAVSKMLSYPTEHNEGLVYSLCSVSDPGLPLGHSHTHTHIHRAKCRLQLLASFPYNTNGLH